MTGESAFIASLRGLAGDPAARGLLDDAAVLETGGSRLVLTHDMIVEGVHFLRDDPPEDIAWKLVAVNLSDLAAKGAEPVGLLLGYMLGRGEWDQAFVRGLGDAIAAFGAPLLGGDTVAAPGGAPRAFGLTAVGRVAGVAPGRAGARAGDDLWVSGSIGDAGLGLRIALGEIAGPATLLARYRRPQPRLAGGQALAPLASAMMDVSDGLLIDAQRMAAASGLSLVMDIARIPLSSDFVSLCGDGREARIAAATAGDDYELLFAAPRDRAAAIGAAGEGLGLAVTKIGGFQSGSGLRLIDGGQEVPLPARMGWEHAAL